MGNHSGNNANNTLNVMATKYKSDQMHVYANGGNDTINMSFDSINVFSHGHHTRGDWRTSAEVNAPGATLGHDVFNFTGFNNVSAVVSGRIEDFDASRDTMQINGTNLNLNGPLPSNVRIVEWMGDHNDAGADKQQYILIDTGSGYLFYALEGARVDMDGNGAGGDSSQERHFLAEAPTEAQFAAMQDVAFIDQKNVIPLGYMPANPSSYSGMIYNDIDEDAEDVLAIITGSGSADLIAAGLNDDTVSAGNGSDRVWGGSGHDSIRGGSGNDTLEGGTGNDTVKGDSGNDHLSGNNGNDKLYGGSGSDRLYGHADNDTLYGQSGVDRLWGQNGNDYLDGGSDNDFLYGGNGNDRLRGGAGQDIAYGHSGADTFIFSTGDGVNFYAQSGTTAEKFGKLDRVEDFNISQDHIDLRNHASVDSMDDLTVWRASASQYGNGDYFAISIQDTGERFLVKVDSDVTYSEFIDTIMF